MNKAVIRSLFIGLLAMPMVAMATVIPYSSFTGTTIDFNSLTSASTLGDGEELHNQFLSYGVTFDVQNFNAYATTGGLASAAQLNSDPTLIWVDQGAGEYGSSAAGIKINFSSAQSKVGLWLGGSFNSAFTLAAYNGSTLVDSITTSFSNGGNYLEGFVALSGSNITQVIAFSTDSTTSNNWNFAIDDLKFSAPSPTPVPEPATIVLLGLGIAVVGYRRLQHK